MSEWEEFSAYRPMIADAKREEREHIIKLIEARKWPGEDLDGDVHNLLTLIQDAD